MEEKAQELALKVSKATKKISTQSGYTLYSDGKRVFNYTSTDVFGFESLCTGGSYRFQVALGKDGRIYQFGYNNGYNIANFTGDRTRGFHMIDLPYEQSGGVKWYDVKHCSTYVLMNNGDLWVWGQNTHGQMGVGNTTHIYIPVKSTTDVVEVILPQQGGYLGSDVRVILKKTDGKYYFAGRNYSDRFCPGQTADKITSWTLMKMPSGTVSKIWSLGDEAGAIFCQLTNNDLYAIGYNTYGSLGIGNTTANITAWTKVLNSNTASYHVVDIQGGYGYREGSNAYAQSNTIFLMSNREVFACGSNKWGSLGQGIVGGVDLHTPARVNISNIKSIHSSGGGTLSVYARTEDDKIYSWGYNGLGQLATGNTTSIGVPKLHTHVIKNIYTATTDYAYQYHNVVIIEDTEGVLWMAGDGGNDPAGRNSTANMTSWTKINTYQKFKQIKPNHQVDGSNNVFFLKDTGELWCTGSNDYNVTKGILIDTEINNNRGLKRAC